MFSVNSPMHGGGLMFAVQPKGISRIAMIYQAMESIRKRLEELGSRLQADAAPQDRMEIQAEMKQLEDMLETLRRELLLLTTEKDRHKPAGGQVLLLPSAPVSNDDGGIYHPPGA